MAILGMIDYWVYHMKVSANRPWGMVINPWQKGFVYRIDDNALYTILLLPCFQHGTKGVHTWRRGKPPCMAMKDWKNMKHHWKKWCPILQDKPKSGVCQYWKEEMMLARFWENVSFIFFFETVKPDGGESPCWYTGGMSIARDYSTRQNIILHVLSQESVFECVWYVLIILRITSPFFPLLNSNGFEQWPKQPLLIDYCRWLSLCWRCALEFPIG